MRIIYKSDAYRIVEHESDFNMEDLMGDCFNPKVNPEIDLKELERQKQEFIDLVNNEGVYGYVLERWDSAVNKGWTEVDSCWGFVGQYSPHEERFNHYIIDELKGQIR
jgi:hypothetical protein